MTKATRLAIRKLQYHRELKQYYGYLTPTEAHALVALGYQPSRPLGPRRGARGNCRWIYFTRTGVGIDYDRL